MGACPWSVGGPDPPGRDSLLRVLGAEAGAGDLDEVGAVGQAVERGRGEQRLAEEVRPLGAIAGGPESRANSVATLY